MTFDSKKIIHFLKNWKMWLFSSGKYLEMGGLFLCLSLCAKRVGPVEMSASIPVFLYITYASYLGLGGVWVIYKNYAQYSTQDKKILLSAVFNWYMLVATIGFLSSFLFIESKYALLTGLVVFMTFLRTYIEAYLRGTEQIVSVAINDLSMILFFIIGVCLFVNSFWDYLFCFAIVKTAAALFYCLQNVKFFVKMCISVFTCKISLNYYGTLLKSGILLAGISLLSSLFLSIDKFFVNMHKGNVVHKGSYQLSDIIAMIAPVFINVVTLYLFPQIVSKLKKSPENEEKYLRVMTVVPFASIPVALVTGVIAFLLNKYFFQDYTSLSLYTFFLTMGKVIVCSLFLLANCYIAQNKEFLVIFYLMIPFVLIVLCDFVLVLLKASMFYFSFVLIFWGIVTFIFMHKMLRKQNISRCVSNQSKLQMYD